MAANRKVGVRAAIEIALSLCNVVTKFGKNIFKAMLPNERERKVRGWCWLR
jgi:hypothetical protein